MRWLSRLHPCVKLNGNLVNQNLKTIGHAQLLRTQLTVNKLIIFSRIHNCQSKTDHGFQALNINEPPWIPYYYQDQTRWTINGLNFKYVENMDNFIEKQSVNIWLGSNMTTKESSNPINEESSVLVFHKLHHSGWVLRHKVLCILQRLPQKFGIAGNRFGKITAS